MKDNTVSMINDALFHFLLLDSFPFHHAYETRATNHCTCFSRFSVEIFDCLLPLASLQQGVLTSSPKLTSH